MQKYVQPTHTYAHTCTPFHLWEKTRRSGTDMFSDTFETIYDTFQTPVRIFILELAPSISPLNDPAGPQWCMAPSRGKAQTHVGCIDLERALLSEWPLLCGAKQLQCLIPFGLSDNKLGNLFISLAMKLGLTSRFCGLRYLAWPSLDHQRFYVYNASKRHT